MPSFIEQVFQLLTTNPGSLAYHLVLAFSIAGAFQASLIQWRSQGEQASRRTTFGLGLLLAFRLVLFGFAALIWQNLVFVPEILPPLDRGITLVSLIIIIWLWCFPTRQKLADAAALILTLLAVGLVAFLITGWLEQPQPQPYNGSWWDTIGESSSVIVAAVGFLTLIIQRPAGWGFGAGMLGLLLAGHVSQLLAPLPEGDFPGAVRLAQIAAYGILYALPQRFLISTVQPIQPEPAKPAVPDMNFLGSFLALAADRDPITKYQKMTALVARLMSADMCLAVSFQEKPDLLPVLGGYRLDRGEALQVSTLTGPLALTLGNALRRGRPIRLPASSTAGGDLGIGTALGSRQIGPLLANPLTGPDGIPAAGIILISPFSNKNWTSEDQVGLASIIEAFGRLVHLVSQSDLQPGEKPDVCREEREIQALQAELENARREASQESSRAESLAALIRSQETAPEGSLVSGPELLHPQMAAQEKGPQQTSESQHIEAELRLALEEIAHLKSALFMADQKDLELKTKTTGPHLSEEKVKTIASISQELRQPMSSILGYTDLLMGESVGILGALQRKFLERIRASTERMNALVDDLLQTAAPKAFSAEPSSQGVDFNILIDEAIAMTMSQMREKNIVLRVDISEKLPFIQVDRDALQQILIHLLQNASSATPPEGEVSLSAHLRQETGKQDFVLLQVSDQGGGIPSEDLQRVFSRLYRIENASIPGLGDTGIGLSIVKSLVDASGGRIWVDTEMDQGSTFSVLLPILVSPSENVDVKDAAV
jgi:signal transduction histidine kinase